MRNNAGPSWEEIDNGTDNSFDILQEAKSVTHTSENEYNKNDINAISDCSRLMPETLQDSPNYSRKGFTWIQEDSLGN